MKTTSIYYEHILTKVESILYNKGYSPYSLGYCIVPGINDRSYYIQDLDTNSAIMRYNNDINLKRLLEDFKDYLENDQPFKILYNGNDYLYTTFLNRLSDYLFEVRNNSYSSKNVVLKPTIEELEKVLKCFENVVPSLTDFIKGLPQNYSSGDEFTSFIPVILSLHNENMFINKDEKYLKKMISDEIDALTGSYTNETHPSIINGIKTYLSNKKPFFIKLNNPNFESNLFDTVQYIVDSKYWAEISEYFPSLNLSKKKKIIDKDLFQMDSNPIFHFNLDKQEILNVSPSIITERDFNKMISLVSEIINHNKPKTIDFIQTCEVQGKVKVIMLGENMSQDLSFKIGKLFEKMIQEYNSDNVIKQSHYHDDSSADNQNKAYLTKAAEVHWLSLEMESTSDSNIKKKTNKL